MTFGRNVISFHDFRKEDYPVVGQKGARLAELTQEGLPVPPGFCLTTTAYQSLLAYNGLAHVLETQDIAAIRQAVLESELPAALNDDIARAYLALSNGTEPGIPVAVRSSATSEDMDNASFAGQYDTFLNVIGLRQLLDSIRACWAGLWNERALTYLQEHGMEHLVGCMGVVVQKQIQPQVAGVLFTLNPLTGREEEMMVESAWGLGEAVVSGRVTPDTYVIDVDEPEIIKRQIAHQHIMFAHQEGGGIQEIPLPPEKGSCPSLTDEQLLRLSNLGRRVQAIYGYPQDIEWALEDGGDFVILQARPMTSFSFDPAMGQWTSGNHREVFPGFPSPLSISLSLRHEYGAALSSFFIKLKMGKTPPKVEWGRLFFGRPYWNLSEVKHHLALIPGFRERNFDATVGIEPTYDGNGVSTPWTPRTVMRAIPILLAFRKLYRTYWQEAKAYQERFMERIEPELDAVDPTKLTDTSLGEWVKRVFDVHWNTNIVAMCVSFLSEQAQEGFEPVMGRLNAGLPPDEQIAEGDLITGLTGVRTAQLGLEMWNLSRQSLENPRVADIVMNTDPRVMADVLQATPAGNAFWNEVLLFIQRNRYMSEVDEDLSKPRWDEDASFALATLQAYARADESLNPARQLEIQRQVRQAAETRALSILSRGWRRIWPFSKRTFLQQLDTVRRYVWWREELRLIASRAFYHTRRFVKELGKRWSAQGLLESPDHIFLLYRRHVLAGIEGKLTSQEAKQFIDRYLRMKACYSNFDPPTTIGQGIRLETRRPSNRSKKGQLLFRGVPCSSGQVEARARVVHNLEEAQTFQRGEVLIAPYTNPAWTPLFNLASAIVIEEGGLLSHGSVVAREYGIPAVVRVEGAVETFHNGQRLRVDGTAGTVEILNDAPASPKPLSILGLEKLVASAK